MKTQETPESQYPYLEKTAWTPPDSYFGYQPIGDFIVYSRHRDSEILTESNFDGIKQALEKAEKSLPPDDDRESLVTVWRASHCLVGWVEYLQLSKNAPDSLKAIANEILHDMDGYPVYNEDDYSERQWNAVYDYWKSCSIKERVSMIQEQGGNIFSARHDDSIPEKVYDDLSQSESFY